MYLHRNHFSCSNCRRIYKIIFNNGKMCTGLVKLPHKSDNFRLCMVRTRDDKIEFDFKRAEAKDIMNLLENLLLYEKGERNNGKKRSDNS